MEMSEFLSQLPEEKTEPVELDVQKAVVESLAADKVEQDERIEKLKTENSSLQSQISNLKSQISDFKSQISNLKSQIEEMRVSLEKVGDVLAANAESTLSNKVTVLERDPEVDDRFPGETRDQVLEVLAAAREAAEKDGRIRRAQLLEGVLMANEPVGNLAKKRRELEKLFADNANILSGTVIAELEKRGISHKKGEDYLLPSEIIKRVY